LLVKPSGAQLNEYPAVLAKDDKTRNTVQPKASTYE
jgi:hypothetical protein